MVSANASPTDRLELFAAVFARRAPAPCAMCVQPAAILLAAVLAAGQTVTTTTTAGPAITEAHREVTESARACSYFFS